MIKDVQGIYQFCLHGVGSSHIYIPVTSVAIIIQ